jgi:hypothetical protein
MDDTDRHLFINLTMSLEATSMKNNSRVVHFIEEQQVGVELLHD